MRKIFRMKESQLENVIKLKRLEEEGFDAGINKKRLKDCPYEKGSTEYKSWYDGWFSSQAGDYLNENIDLYDKKPQFIIKIKPYVSGVKTYKGLTVDWIDSFPMVIGYDIEFIKGKHGYIDYEVVNIMAPTKINLLLQLINDETDEESSENINIPFDINNIVMDKTTSKSDPYLGLLKDVDMILDIKNDEIVLKEIIFIKNMNLSL